ncbi:MAG: Maf family protein [Micrococcaceae bacterium]
MYSISLVLASASPARLQTLYQAGLRPLVQASDVDERSIEAALDEASSQEIALTLAKEKARSVSRSFDLETHVVIGCDSVFEHNGHSWGKPHTAENAFERIKAQQGTQGILHSGIWLLHRDISIGRADATQVIMDTMTDQEINAYIATGEPLEVAGSFTLDGLGSAFIKGVVGDPHNVVGISVNALKDLLAQAHLSITDFWV